MNKLRKIAISVLTIILTVFIANLNVNAAKVEDALLTLEGESGVNAVIIGEYVFDLNKDELTLSDVVKASRTIPTGWPDAVYWLNGSVEELNWYNLATGQDLTSTQIKNLIESIDNYSGGNGLLSVIANIPELIIEIQSSEIADLLEKIEIAEDTEVYSSARLAEYTEIALTAIEDIKTAVKSYDVNAILQTVEISRVLNEITSIVSKANTALGKVVLLANEMDVEKISLNVGALNLSNIKYRDEIDLTKLVVTVHYKGGTTEVADFEDLTITSADATTYISFNAEGTKITAEQAKAEVVVTVTHTDSSKFETFKFKIVEGVTETIEGNVYATYSSSNINFYGLPDFDLEYSIDGVAWNTITGVTSGSATVSGTFSAGLEVYVRVKAVPGKYPVGNPIELFVSKVLEGSDNLSILKPISKGQYFGGEAIDLTGLEIVISYSDGTIVPVTITKYDLTGITPDKLVVGQNTVTVNYGGKTVNFNIVVNKAAAPIITDTITATYEYGTTSGDITLAGFENNLTDVKYKISFDGGLTYGSATALTINSNKTATIPYVAKTAAVLKNTMIKLQLVNPSYHEDGIEKIITIAAKEDIIVAEKDTTNKTYVGDSLSDMAAKLDVTKINADGTTSEVNISASNIKNVEYTKDAAGVIVSVTFDVEVSGLKKSYTLDVYRKEAVSVDTTGFKAEYSVSGNVYLSGMTKYAGTKGVLEYQVLTNSTTVVNAGSWTAFNVKADGTFKIEGLTINQGDNLVIAFRLKATTTHLASIVEDEEALEVTQVPEIDNIIFNHYSSGGNFIYANVSYSFGYLTYEEIELVTRYEWYYATAQDATTWTLIAGANTNELETTALLGSAYVKLVAKYVNPLTNEVINSYSAVTKVSRTPLTGVSGINLDKSGNVTFTDGNSASDVEGYTVELYIKAVEYPESPNQTMTVEKGAPINFGSLAAGEYKVAVKIIANPTSVNYTDSAFVEATDIQIEALGKVTGLSMTNATSAEVTFTDGNSASDVERYEIVLYKENAPGVYEVSATATATSPTHTFTIAESGNYKVGVKVIAKASGTLKIDSVEELSTAVSISV